MAVVFPEHLSLVSLTSQHKRTNFSCGEPAVEQWLSKFALQNQKRHLSVTKVLIDDSYSVLGFYTLATGQIDFRELPDALVKKLPKRSLPVAMLAWLAVDTAHQGQGLGSRLLAQALCDCYSASKTFAFIAVVIDALHNQAKQFYRQWDFNEIPGHPNRLFLSAEKLKDMMGEQ